jgi:hypothetical protein
VIEYLDFLAAKAPRAKAAGFEPGPMHEALRPDQRDVTAFCLRQGRAALFLDTGMGKSLDQLEWCEQAGRASNGYSLILTDLAIAKQFKREADKFGYEANIIRFMEDVRPGISICNYDRLDNLDPSAFGAVSLDESSILKSLNGRTRIALTQMFQDTPYRLCATATPAPNDHMELGTHAEFLGIMSSQEMLSRWFINDTSTASQSWRLKKSATTDFWDWVASWARCAQTPADLGYDIPGFDLPPLKIIRHDAMGDVRPAAGSLFIEDVSATSMHEIKRQTADLRARRLAEVVQSQLDEAWSIWVETDYESDAIRKYLPDIPELKGSLSLEKKEEIIERFLDSGSVITKPKITGRGQNWQHSARMALVGRSFSYEQFYQLVRRSWRYGQAREVELHLFIAEGEDQLGRVIDRKADDHSAMKTAMAAAMKRARRESESTKIVYNPKHTAKIPSWL